MAKPYSERIDKLREDTIKKLADDNGLFYDSYMWCSSIGYLKQHCYVKFDDYNRCFDITFDPSETSSKEIPCQKLKKNEKPSSSDDFRALYIRNFNQVLESCNAIDKNL